MFFLNGSLSGDYTTIKAQKCYRLSAKCLKCSVDAVLMLHQWPDLRANSANAS